MTRTIEYIPIEDLKENPRNVKDHEIPTVTASISRFGVIDPIVVDARTGYIVSGHGRRQTLLNMRDAGELPPEGVILEGEGKNRTWLVPVLTGWSSNCSKADFWPSRRALRGNSGTEAATPFVITDRPKGWRPGRWSTAGPFVTR